MTNFDITSYETDRENNAETANDALEAKLDTIANTKTIRFVKIVKIGVMYQGLLLYDT